MKINNQSKTIEAFYIHLLSSVEAAFQEVYEDYVENYEKFEMVVIDLQNRRVTEKKKTMMVKDVECGKVVYVPLEKKE